MSHGCTDWCLVNFQIICTKDVVKILQVCSSCLKECDSTRKADVDEPYKFHFLGLMKGIVHVS